MYKRIFLIVMDSVGVGYCDDSHLYGDEGYNTLQSIINTSKIDIPTLASLGIDSLVDLKTACDKHENSLYGKLKEISIGKDTMTGHLEMMGLRTEKPLKTFTDTGFPDELIKELEERTGRKVIGNIAASGTQILEDMIEEHVETGALIVYTSADSVLQIAANEDIVPLTELYNICKIAREITMKEEWKVGRVIARPFVGMKKGELKRTPNRHDYALSPFDKTVMDTLKDNDFTVYAIGKINDIFNTQGVTKTVSTKSNFDGMEKTIEALKEDFTGLCFVNLVDFDALYGHRRDPIGYGKCLEEFDGQLKEFMANLNDDDLLILTADHGNDPTAHGTDHTREYVPLLVYANNLKESKNLGTLESFACIGATITDNFKLEMPKYGTSFLNNLQ